MPLPAKSPGASNSAKMNRVVGSGNKSVVQAFGGKIDHVPAWYVRWQLGCAGDGLEGLNAGKNGPEGIPVGGPVFEACDVG